MKILLINPPYTRLRGSNECTEMITPQGISYLAAVAETGGYDVRVFDANVAPSGKKTRFNKVGNLVSGYGTYKENVSDDAHPAWRDVRSEVENFSPDVIGITTLSPVLGSAMMTACICRDVVPNAKIVMGGFHPTSFPEDVLKHNTVHYVVRSEGEETFAELLDCIRDGRTHRDVAGLSYMEAGVLKNNPDRPLIRDLDSLPMPVKFLNGRATGKLPVQYSRGCPYGCRFCADSVIWRRRTRNFSPETIVEYMKQCVSFHGIREFTFVDGTFNVSRKRVHELCEAIIGSGLKVLWDALVRADELDDEMLRICRKAGCTQMNIGIESGSQSVLDDLNKGTSIANIKNEINRIRKHNMAAVSFFCIGMPPETKGDMSDTHDLIKLLKHDYVILHMFTPIPGSEYFTQLLESGRIPEGHDYDSFGYKSDMNSFSGMATREEFEYWRKKIGLLVDVVNSRGLLPIKLLMKNFMFYLKFPGQLYRRVVRLAGY